MAELSHREVITYVIDISLVTMKYLTCFIVVHVLDANGLSNHMIMIGLINWIVKWRQDYKRIIAEYLCSRAPKYQERRVAICSTTMEHLTMISIQIVQLNSCNCLPKNNHISSSKLFLYKVCNTGLVAKPGSHTHVFAGLYWFFSIFPHEKQKPSVNIQFGEATIPVVCRQNKQTNSSVL